jgi:hypothetical protein
MHAARLRPGRHELVWRPAAWEELGRRGATFTIVTFSGRAGRGGCTDTIKLLRSVGEELVDVERWTSRDELCYALEVVWSAENRCVVIRAVAVAMPTECGDRTAPGRYGHRQPPSRYVGYCLYRCITIRLVGWTKICT